MSETKPLTEQTPREIDTQLAKLYEKFFQARMRRDSAETRVREAHAGRPLYGRTVEEIEESFRQAEAAMKAIAAEMVPFEREFTRRGGWKRYYLVPGGHVHRERNCSTCHWNTRFGWLVELADCDENAMVKEHGDGACAVCFPEVQTHPDFLRAKALREAREAAEAQRLCPASGTYVSGQLRYVKCQQCGVAVHRSPRGKLRKHNPPVKKT